MQTIGGKEYSRLETILLEVIKERQYSKLETVGVLSIGSECS